MNQKYRNYILKQNKSYIILFTVMMAAVFPAIVTIQLLVQDYSTTNEAIQTDGYILFLTVLACFFASIIPFLLLNYKNSRKSVDLYHSLPMTRKALFRNNLIVAMTILIISTAIAYWSGYGILYLFTNLSFQKIHLQHFIRLSMMFFVLMMPSIFTIMNTGTLADSLVYTLIVILLPLLAYASFNIFSAANIFGFEPFNLQSLKYASPFVATFYMFDFINTTFSIKLLIYWMILAYMLYRVSLKLYEKWPSECSESPISNAFFFPFISTIFTAIIFTFLISSISFPTSSKIPYLSIQNLLLPVLISYIIYATLTIFKERSADALRHASKKYLLIIGTTLSLLTVFRQTNGLGVYTHLPKADKIVSISIENNHNQSYFLPLDSPYVITDKEAIDLILDFNEALINDYQEGNLEKLSPYTSIGKSNTTVQLHYKLKSGRSLKRSYQIPLVKLKQIQDIQNYQDVAYRNHPIINPEYTLQNILITDPLMSEQKQFHGDLRQLQKLILEDMKHIRLSANSSEIVYQLLYLDDIYYQFPIDGRFEKTITYLNQHLSQGERLETSYTLVDKDEGLEVNDGYMNLAQQSALYWPDQQETISLEEARKYETKLRSKDVDGSEKEGLIIIIENLDNSVISMMPIHS